MLNLKVENVLERSWGTRKHRVDCGTHAVAPVQALVNHNAAAAGRVNQLTGPADPPAPG